MKPIAMRMKFTSLLPAVLVAIWVVGSPAISPGAHTKAETEDPSTIGQTPAGPAEPPAPAPPATPKDALRAYDAALPAGGMEAAEAAYYCDGEQQRRAAHAMAEVDVATSQLQKKVKEKFGPAAVEVILHAARNATLDDLRQATEKIEGDHATITWRSNRPAVPMVRVEGKWQVSVALVLADFGKDADLDDFVQTCGQIVTQLHRTTGEFDAGEYPNVTLLERAIRQRFFRLLGEER
jgi:hypothetical protein